MLIFNAMYIKLIIGWTVYFFIHSLLASNRVKRFAEQNIPTIFTYYRIIFNLIAVAGLLIMVNITLSDRKLLFDINSAIKIISFILFFSGLTVLGIASKTFDLKEFIGLKKHQLNAQNKLVTKGIYKYVRHPLYTGTILVTVGCFLYLPTLSVMVFLVLTFIYIEIGSRLEEQKLIEEFGNDYIEYCKTVKRYFPFIY
jgi:protein-S-isoprenylcysteine O-methyltransferase Ste14